MTIIELDVSAMRDVYWTISSHLGVLSNASYEILAPDGRRASPMEGPVEWVQWQTIYSDPYNEMLLLHAPEPVDGSWVVEIAGLPAETLLGIQTIMSSDWQLSVEAPLVGRVLRPVVIELALTHFGAPISDVLVEASVRGPVNGTEQPLSFADDGVAPDRIQDDGIFTGEFMPLIPGHHRVSVEANFDGITRETVRGIPVISLASAGEPTCFDPLLVALEGAEPHSGVDVAMECATYRAPSPAGS